MSVFTKLLNLFGFGKKPDSHDAHGSEEMPTIFQDTLDVDGLTGMPLGGVSYGGDNNGPRMGWNETLKNSRINQDYADTFVIPGQVNARRPNMQQPMPNMQYPQGYPQQQPGYPQQQQMQYPQGYPQQPGFQQYPQQAAMPPQQMRYAQPQPQPQLTPQQIQQMQMQQQQIRMAQQQQAQAAQMQQQQAQAPAPQQVQQVQPAEPQQAGAEDGEPFYEMILLNNTYHFFVDLPGVNKSTVDVQYIDGAVEISGVRELQSTLMKKTAKGEKGRKPVFETQITVPEYLSGKFKFSFPAFNLPIDENSIDATFKDGILHVTMNLRPSATGVKVVVK